MPADPALPDDEVRRRLLERPGWAAVDGRLHRDFLFAGFTDAFAFMTAVALEAQALDHHPDWANSWNRVSVGIVSHAAGGITDRCFRLADACDRHGPPGDG